MQCGPDSTRVRVRIVNPVNGPLGLFRLAALAHGRGHPLIVVANPPGGSLVPTGGD